MAVNPTNETIHSYVAILQTSLLTGMGPETPSHKDVWTDRKPWSAQMVLLFCFANNA